MILLYLQCFWKDNERKEAPEFRSFGREFDLLFV
uniref:Uncharacterized protein n=1 Tax=Medicago truncatula TaxID=3880 RepID=I3SCM6_MEDTR|nr:unknown [Medicago truncatula]